MYETKARKFFASVISSALAVTISVGVLPAHAKATQHPTKATQSAKITAARANAIVLKNFQVRSWQKPRWKMKKAIGNTE